MVDDFSRPYLVQLQRIARAFQGAVGKHAAQAASILMIEK
jgi:hypothetical protein